MEKKKLFGFIFVLMFMGLCIAPLNGQNVTAEGVSVGVILDLDTTVGKIIKVCLTMAVEDVNANHNYSIRIVPHFRDSMVDDVQAASAAIGLLKNVQVHAIIGPQRSTQAEFILNIGNKVKVPIISPATSPSLSPKELPYFIRSSQCSSAQARAIAAVVKAYGWREIVFIYEDSNYGSGIIPYLSDAMVDAGTSVAYQSVLPPSASDNKISKELYKLMTMQTRVFVVHMLPSLASRFFHKVQELEMMSKGYAWIIADALTSLLDSVNSEVIEEMQGVLGVKAYIPKSQELNNFTKRWGKRFHEEYPNMERVELNVFGLWAYDSVMALAMATKRVDLASKQYKKPDTRASLTDLDAIGVSESGPSLSKSLRNIDFKGLSGDFHIVDGELQQSAFQIVNVIGKGEKQVGFWTRRYGISNNLRPKEKDADYSTNKDILGAIIWPGDTHVIPRGWKMPTGKRKLRVGVPVKIGFTEFVKVEKDPGTNDAIVTGFCIDLFKEVIQSLPYAVPCEFIPFQTPDGKSAGNYDDLVYQIVDQKYDAVVGDVTIVANRSRFVDFTLPYSESGVSTVVPIKSAERKNAWIFMKPLTMDLWLTIGAFFIFTGFVVWVLEHRVNKEFRGPPRQQVGMIFWFSFSTLVFAQKEKVTSNLARFVVIIWMFVVLVLTSSYTASLTSMLTVQQLQPTITDIYDLIKNGEYVGYHDGSFVKGLLEDMKFDSSKLISYASLQDYHKALSMGSRKGGVTAVVDEIPYLRLFLAKYGDKYTMIGPTFKTAGFGFAFPKNSPLVADVSRALLNVTEGAKMMRKSREWFGEEKPEDCQGKTKTAVTSHSLTLDSFKGLFVIAGVSSSSALIIFLSMFCYESRIILASDASISRKISAMAKLFNMEKSMKSPATTGESRGASPDNMPGSAQSPAISISYHAEGMLSNDEGFSTTEPGTPIHSAIEE